MANKTTPGSTGLQELLSHNRQRLVLTKMMQLNVECFLGWTTEYLTFVPVSDTFALIDEEDGALVRSYTWYLQVGTTGIYYALACDYQDSWRKQKTIRMHRLLAQTPEGLHTDHKNHNGLDNRKSNLRVATPSQNHANQRVQKGNKHKGVNKTRNGWAAFVVVNGKRIYLGRFSNEEDAANAYNQAAVRHFGEFALLNRV